MSVDRIGLVSCALTTAAQIGLIPPSPEVLRFLVMKSPGLLAHLKGQTGAAAMPPLQASWLMDLLCQDRLRKVWPWYYPDREEVEPMLRSRLIAEGWHEVPKENVA